MKIPDLTLPFSGARLAGKGSVHPNLHLKAKTHEVGQSESSHKLSKSSRKVRDQLDLSSHEPGSSTIHGALEHVLANKSGDAGSKFGDLVYRLALSIRRQPNSTREGQVSSSSIPENKTDAVPETKESLHQRSDSSVLSRIETFLNENNLNQYGDPQGTIYAGGTPLLDESTGKTHNRLEYLLSKFPELTIG